MSGSAARIAQNLARYATSSSSTGKYKVVVVGGGEFKLVDDDLLLTYAGTGGLAAANQIYDLLQSRGKALAPGDIAIIDVSSPL